MSRGHRVVVRGIVVRGQIDAMRENRCTDPSNQRGTAVTQPMTPSPGPQSGATTPPPADDGSYIHPERRAVLWALRAITYLIYAYLLFVQIILGLGFILLLLGANPSSGFVEWWYRNLDRVMEPFRGIFTPIELGTTQGNQVESIFETSVLFAMIIYAIVAIAVSAFAGWLGKRMHRLDVEDRAYHERMAYERQAYLDRVSAERNAQTVAQATNQQPPAAPPAAPPTPPPTPPAG